MISQVAGSSSLSMSGSRQYSYRPARAITWLSAGWMKYGCLRVLPVLSSLSGSHS